MKAFLTPSVLVDRLPSIQITGSKSESNRLLILKALYPEIQIKNLSESDDTLVLKKALASKEDVIDVHHAGTAMRFLTAYFSTQKGRELILTGSERMLQRPIGVLVDALRALGARIEYLGNEGFPPLRIQGRLFENNEVSIKANTSSQYISALMLIAPSLPNGLTIHLLGEVTSIPYIEMTLSLLKQIGVEGVFYNSTIKIRKAEHIANRSVTVESDWSSASYFYSIAALSNNINLSLKSYKKESLQGDAALAHIYQVFGVDTLFSAEEHEITLIRKPGFSLPNQIDLDLVKTPDIAQTIAVTCFGLGIACTLTGLHTLKIKETDRLEALKVELEKLGATVKVTDHSFHLSAASSINEAVEIETYHDHRMAMAFAPLAIKTSLTILDCNVVSKSFPTFWKDLETLGFSIGIQ